MTELGPPINLIGKIMGRCKYIPVTTYESQCLNVFCNMSYMMNMSSYFNMNLGIKMYHSMTAKYPFSSDISTEFTCSHVLRSTKVDSQLLACFGTFWASLCQLFKLLRLTMGH